MSKSNLSRAESYHRLQAQIIYRDKQSIEVSRIEIDNISDDFERTQSSRSRNVKLTLGFGIVSTASVFVNFYNSLFPEKAFSKELIIVTLVLAFLALLFFIYQFITSKVEKSKTLEELKIILNQHKERQTYIDDIPYNQQASQPPPLRIESG